MPDMAHGPRITVVGGGIGGLRAAAFLRRAGLSATVYEQAPALAQGAARSIEDAAVPAHCLTASGDDPEQALRRCEAARVERTTRLQRVSHARCDIDHLPDGPEQRSRDAALAGSDPLVRNGWIYGHDAEDAIGDGSTAR
ncbi:NAD(P)-binding protein [Streptomyces sp. bgisy034]|uniref:NAD(P)-binding protein n=1 Tax=Streptomyces sp. bgisy034 TaxID=3413774 RepID=UPI003EBF2428